MPIPQLKPKSDQQHDDSTRFRKTWRSAGGSPSGDDRGILASLGGFVAMRLRRGASRLGKGLRSRSSRQALLRLWLPVATIVVLLFVFSVIVVFAWFSRDLPDPNKISERSVAESTRIYARDEKTLLYEIHGNERRTVVELNEISPDVVHATVAIEDKDFYRHKGFSLTGIARALWKDVTAGSLQGGSTITQQFVKNAILTREKRLARKVRELVLAYQIERRFTKDQILKLYFNEIPYGANAYGVEAAAETFFGKPARTLTLAESAILAALPQAPTYYSPYGNNAQKLLGRSHYILDLMVEQGYISAEQAEAAKSENILASVKPKRETILAPHFVFYVRELLTQKYGEKTVERGGLRVTTTLDIDKQLAAETAIADQAPINEKRWSAKNAALVSLDPKTGQVLAMVGSRDYFDTSIDGNVNVALTLQQPGSSIKPIVYATAFTRGFTPDTILFDLRTKFKVPGSKDYFPQNYDGKNRGPVTMRRALAGSLNIPAVKTLYLTGVDRVIDQAQKMGYTTWDDRSRLGLSLVLGGADVKLIEHTAALGSFATDGVLHATTPILKVQDKTSKVLEEFKDQKVRVLDENIARTVSDVLSDNQARSFIFGSRNRLTLPDRAVAAKTGTTQEYRDGWTMGFTPATSKEPAVVTGVWVGNNGNTPMRQGADGSVVAAPIWNSFMRKATAGTKPAAFNKPKVEKPEKPVLRGKLEGEAPINVDRVTGEVIPSSCLDSWPKEFVTEKTVRAVHTILYYVDPNDPTGPPPTDPRKNLQFSSWEEPIQAWAKKNGYVEEWPRVALCDLRTKKPVVSIASPTSNTTVVENSVVVTIAVDSTRPLTSIVYKLDDQLLLTAEPAVLTATLDLSGVSNGFRTITAVVTDDVGNVAQAKVDINVLRGTTTSSLYFLSPSGNTSVSHGTTLSLQAYAVDPGVVISVTFLVVDPQSTTTDVATVNIGPDSKAAASWLVPPTAGLYRIFFRATTASGLVRQSDSLNVTVV